jgi:hypothetical protein
MPGLAPPILGPGPLPPAPDLKQEAVRIPPALVGRLKPETLQQLQAQYANGGVNSLPAAFEKKLRRLEKNRESARGG